MSIKAHVRRAPRPGKRLAAFVSALIVLVSLGAWAQPASANELANGSFEVPVVADNATRLFQGPITLGGSTLCRDPLVPKLRSAPGCWKLRQGKVKIGDDNVWPADSGRQSLRLMNTLNRPVLRQSFPVTGGQWYELSMAVARDPAYPSLSTVTQVSWHPYDATGRELSGKGTGFVADSASYTTHTEIFYAWPIATSVIFEISYNTYIGSHDMLIDSMTIVPTDPPPGV